MAAMTSKKKRILQSLFRLYSLIIIFALLVAATYTWLTISRTPKVSDLYLYANTPVGMELSADPGAAEWKRQLDYGDLLDVHTVLRPVTWSEEFQRFYAATYGPDGRQINWRQMADEYNANKDTLDGYYVKVSYYARTDQDVTVSLSPAVEVDEGVKGSGTYLIGFPEWDDETVSHYNAGNNAECAVRIGFRFTPVSASGAALGSTSEFIIYEPNSDAHPMYGFHYDPTPSIDGTETLVPEERLILQTDSVWTEANPVQRNVVMHRLGEFTTDPELFFLKSGEIMRIDMYIWLEGQDKDCEAIYQKAKIMASIQFAADAGTQSGLVPIG